MNGVFFLGFKRLACPRQIPSTEMPQMPQLAKRQAKETNRCTFADLYTARKNQTMVTLTRREAVQAGPENLVQFSCSRPNVFNSILRARVRISYLTNVK